MVDIASHQGPVPLPSVSGRQEISLKYLQQLAFLLCRRGLLVSVKGMNGGYSLTRNKEEITLLEILSSLEGDLGFSQDLPANENVFQRCLRVNFYEVADKRLRALLAGTTLSDLVDSVAPSSYEYDI